MAPLKKLNLGILEITLSVTAMARLEIEEVRIENLRTTSRIGAPELTDIVLPYELFNLTLARSGLNESQLRNWRYLKHGQGITKAQTRYPGSRS